MSILKRLFCRHTDWVEYTDDIDYKTYYCKNCDKELFLQTTHYPFQPGEKEKVKHIWRKELETTSGHVEYKCVKTGKKISLHVVEKNIYEL